jgi:hypothetical protein
VAIGAALLLSVPATASASHSSLTDPSDQWLPSTPGATWTYAWSDSAYAKTPTVERYTLAKRMGATFRIRWTTQGLPNGPGTIPSAGYMDFQRTDAGLVNRDWAGTPAPAQFPILCSKALRCPNSLAGTLYMAIWGSRAPVIAGPVVRGLRFSSQGGAAGDVASDNRYLGRHVVTVPAFPRGVEASEIRSKITQAGALGDPFGSATRTTWWVRGVGPVKIVLNHIGGAVDHAALQSTNLTPRRAPPDTDYFPLRRGERMDFRWRNSRHLRHWSHQRFRVTQVVNNTARVEVKSRKRHPGPIRVAGVYLFACRLSGVTNLAGSAKAITHARFPKLGHHRHFLTPFDLMVYGFNPILSAYPAKGDHWRAPRRGRDFKTFGVRGRSKIVGTRRVRVPAGRFKALKVVSHLRQRHHRFGSGRRVSFFAPGKGLVKLVFHHRDGSVSTVQRTK